MRFSVRSHLAAGLWAVAAGIIAVPSVIPSVIPRAMPEAVAAPAPTAQRVALTASVRSLVVQPPNPGRFASAVAAIERLDPERAQAGSGRAQAGSGQAQAASGRSAKAAVDPTGRATAIPSPLAVAAPLNAASDWITSGYQFIQYWVDYGVELADYVLQFIPYGYLISGQINIFYYNLIRPIADSVVYGLINPVVNDPLNPASWINGFLYVGQATVNALINTGIAELNYFFGWLIPPIPPIPFAATEADLALSPLSTLSADLESMPGPTAARLVDTAESGDLTGLIDPDATTDPEPLTDGQMAVVDTAESDVATEQASTPLVEPSPQDDETLAAGTESEKTEPSLETPTTTSAGGVQAQGIVRGSTTTTNTTTIPTTAAGQTTPSNDEIPVEAGIDPVEADPTANAGADQPGTEPSGGGPEQKDTQGSDNQGSDTKG